MNKWKCDLINEMLADGKIKVDVEHGIVYSRTSPNHPYKKPVICINPNTGYQVLNISFEGKSRTFSVHQLVMVAAGHGDELIGRVVNHINGIRTDNRIANLEAVTYGQNAAHAWKLRRKRLGLD